MQKSALITHIEESTGPAKLRKATCSPLERQIEPEPKRKAEKPDAGLARLVKELKRYSPDWPYSQVSAVYLLFDVCQILGLAEVATAQVLGRRAFRYLKQQGLFTLEETDIPTTHSSPRKTSSDSA